MPSIIVVGTQFGDEGKGKITDLLAEQADLVVRYQGGNNAGHTVVVGKKTYKFHLLPSGLLQGKRCLVGAGVALDPKVLLEEMKQLQGKTDLGIDPRTQVIMPWHNLLDNASESNKGEKKIGTTGRGIGPCYADRASRTGIRFADLAEEERLMSAMQQAFPAKERILKSVFGIELEAFDYLFKQYKEIGEKLGHFGCDVSMEVHEALEQGKSVLFEGAQGTFLDNDFGTYPFVTASHPIAGAVFTGVGLGVRAIDRVIGVAKAYTTRVGSGPFVTELCNETGERMRKQGSEFGTTTGRPRRCGWLDLALLRTAVRLNGLTEIALTKLDVLNGIEDLQICTAYDCNGGLLKEFPPDWKLLEECKPVYREFKGFEVDSKAKRFEELPGQAREYVEFIERELGVRISIVSVGAERNQTILR